MIKEMLGIIAETGDCLLIDGPHGIGKSEMCAQFSDENKYFHKTLYLAQMEAGDILGIPYINEDGTTTWATPSFFKELRDAHNKGSRCVVVLEELNRAPLEIANASMQLMLEKRINDHLLPPNTIIASTINPANGKYKVSKFDPALMNRFLHIRVEANAHKWLQYAKSKNAHNAIITYIAKNEDKLVYSDEKSEQSATPRSWLKLSENLMAYEKLGVNNNEVLKNLICGKVGLAVGGQFYNYYLESSKLIEPSDVISFVEKESKGKEITQELVESIAANMSKKLLKDQEPVQLQNLIERLGKIYVDVGVKESTIFASQHVLNTETQRLTLPIVTLINAVDMEIAGSTIKQAKLADKALHVILTLSDNRVFARKLMAVKNS
jgi:hypothetical protein